MAFRKTIPLYISSDPSFGAVNIDSNNNHLTFNLNPSIAIPHKYNTTIRLVSANIWYTIPNVSATLYNNNTLQYSNDGITWTTLSFPTGLYDLGGINDYISDSLINAGLAYNLIQISGIQATGHTSISLGNATMRINFTNSTIRTLLGFNAGTIGPGIAGQVYVSNNAATLNSLESIMIHCSIAAGSYLGIQGGSDVIAKVTPDVSPGELIQFMPIHLIDTHVSGRNISSISFTLTDQANRTIDLSAEYYSFIIELVLTPD